MNAKQLHTHLIESGQHGAAAHVAALGRLRGAAAATLLASRERHLALLPSAPVDAIRLLPGGGHRGGYGTRRG